MKIWCPGCSQEVDGKCHLWMCPIARSEREAIARSEGQMTDEQAAELRYEAGMYQSLYETAKARIEALEKALREIDAFPLMIEDEEVREIIRAALGSNQDKP